MANRKTMKKKRLQRIKYLLAKEPVCGLSKAELRELHELRKESQV